MKHPIDSVMWVDPAQLQANDYNPNTVFDRERDLLRTSLIEDGWTQAIVVRRAPTDNGIAYEIVDGFHRWTLGSTDPEVVSIGNGMVPIVILEPRDAVHMRMSTVRHNRARGKHGVLAMAQIVQWLQEEGVSAQELVDRMGLDPEEAARLADVRTTPERMGSDTFGKGWTPTRQKPDR